MTNKIHREKNGTLPAYAWPGRYQMIYYCEDGAELCPACANGENGSRASVANDDAQWNIVAQDIYYEGPAIPCAHCNAPIPSAYGDPDESNEN